MFPNESSSDEISTESSNAFVQNRKEPAEHRGVCRGVATLSQQALACPVDQVPVARDTTGDRTMSGSSSVAAVSLMPQDPSSPLSTKAAAAAIALTQHSNSKDKPLLLEVAMTEEGVTQEQAGRIVMHTAVAAAGPCDPKSEAVGAGETSPCSSANFSASVIFPRSRCGDGGELVSPSLQMGSSDSSSSQGAQEGSNAGSHLGSSSSSNASLQYRAQSSIQAKSDSPPPPHAAQLPPSPHTTNVKLTEPRGAHCVSSQPSLNIPQQYCVASNAGWGIPRGLGLRGGGESSLNSGTAGWGTPPSASNSNNAGGWGQNPPAQNSNPNQGQWGTAPRPGNANQGPPGQPNPGFGNFAVKGNQSPQQGQQQQQQQPTSASGGQQGGGGQQSASQPPQSSQSGNGSGSGQQQPPQNGSPSWAQAAGGAGGGGGPGKGPGQPPGPNGGGSSSAKQLEQLNSMREALFSQDGWGGQHVNQDTGWDIPTSPEPGMKDNGGGGPVWKPNVNNGTDLWEANLRNGGQPPPTTSKTPWGHTPATNIGGTWGEDDDVGDSSNVWHGVPSNNTNNPPGPQWGGAPAPVPKKDSEWGGSNWGDPRDMRGNMMDPRSNDRDMRGGMGMDLRGGGGDMMRPDMMMRGDPRGPGGPDPRMGRMNGEAPMWGGPKNQQPPGNQWAGPPPKDMKSSSGWEELSPTAARRQIPNYDDGTSLWGNPGQQQANTWRGNKQHDGGKVSHWKEIPTPNMGGRGGAGGMQCPPGMGQNRMPGSGGMKPDGSGPMWNHPQRNGSWADGPGGPHDGPGGWADEGPGKMGGGWNDSTLLGGGQGNWGGPKPKNPMSQGGWGDGSDVDPSSWGHPKPGPKPLTKDIVWASKQFRILSEMGFKKEDVENALRTCNMSLEDALEYLQGMNPGVRGGNDGWRRHEEHSPFDMGVSGGPHPGGPGGGGYPGRGYNPTQQMPFAPPGPGVNNAPSLMNSANNPSLGSINTMSPAIVQKILTQQPPPAAQPSAQQSFQSVPRNPQSQPQPSAAQLRMLVQQIQMAVQAGYLNHQILNQPLAPQTLLLLNQLLQQIKMLQNLLQQQAVTQVQPMGKGQSAAVLQISVQITKTKQQITNLQNQIAAQQAIYVKQQQHQQHMAPQGPQTGDFFKPQTIPDPISALHGNFGELSMKEPQQASFQTQQSRLNQWKLPSLDKDGDGSGINEFDRAPGTTTKTQSHTSPNMNPLLPQGDSTWSSVGRGGGDTGWPDTSAPGDGSSQADGKEWPNSAAQSSAAFTDLVPEFEPGKPWKGTQMKSIEDDPSITPGSVVRSPLSLATIKDTEIFSSSNKTSPPASVVASSSDNSAIPSLSLSSTTWSFNPTSSSSSAFASLATNGSNGSGRGGPTGSSSSWGGMPPGGGWSSTWLLLRNLTPQIDGSTLKTLCLQHGPLQSFHLYLNHGLALAKYQSREEAAKAQGALNNCVLGNTTIFAESPAEAEVHGLLQHLHVNQPQGPSVASGWGSMRGGPNSSQNAPPQQGPQPPQQGPSKPPPDAWGGGSSGGGGSQLWPSPSSSSLWGASGLDGGDQHRATPSSLNSFLPGDLLGEGSM